MTIQAHAPKEAVNYFFWPLVNFESEDVHSAYVKGMRYQVREGNDKLHILVKDWKIKGLVSLSPPEKTNVVKETKKPWWRVW